MLQMKLLFSGHRYYRNLSDVKKSPQVTDRITRSASTRSAPLSESDQNGSIFVLNQRYAKHNVQFVRGQHFTKESLSAPTKARIDQEITGRNVLELTQSTLGNLKKAIAFADEFLDSGSLPSGKNWDDLYDYLLEKIEELSKEKSGYTGWIAFEVLTKYNDVGEDVLSIITSDGGSKRDGDESRLDYRKKAKTNTLRMIR